MSELSAFRKTATWSLLGYSELRPPQERIECQVLVLTQQRHTLNECPACQALEKLSFLVKINPGTSGAELTEGGHL